MSIARPTGASDVRFPGSPPQAVDAPIVEPTSTGNREVLNIAARIRGDHPDVPIDVITGLVDTAYTDLGTARVQAFRHILTERSVRRHLQAKDQGRTSTP